MAASAPVCNVTVFTPAPVPGSPGGFRFLSPRATLQDVIDVLNNNFSPQVQQDEFNRQLDHDINGKAGGVKSKQTGKSSPPKQSKNQVPKKTKDDIGKIRFRQAAIVRQKIKVENPKDKEQWVIDDRVKSLLLKDKTGAQWTWQDKQAGKGVQAGTEESTDGEGYED